MNIIMTNRYFLIYRRLIYTYLQTKYIHTYMCVCVWEGVYVKFYNQEIVAF